MHAHPYKIVIVSGHPRLIFIYVRMLYYYESLNYTSYDVIILLRILAELIHFLINLSVAFIGDKFISGE